MPTTRYKEAVKQYGDDAIKMLDDHVIRQKETELILDFIFVHTPGNEPPLRKVLDVGCGDGTTLQKLSDNYLADYYGLDLTKELIDIARRRNIENCEFFEGDAVEIPFKDEYFDIVYTQRLLVNIQTWEDQQRVVDEIHRVLKPGGYYLLIEGFTDGLEKNNLARNELGLPTLQEAPFNKYLEKDAFLDTVRPAFHVNAKSANFLSSHYFISRVLHPAITRGMQQKKNTEFVKFFSYLPAIGDYSPIQAYILQKKEHQ